MAEVLFGHFESLEWGRPPERDAGALAGRRE